MPDIWCQGLITPIYKSGDKNDPTNYRGICVSSCLGKLFCSILNQRLYSYLEENKILHNSQIGFLPENRTADHVFTLRTLLDKYVHYHKEKVYACFVDFRKAFDSVWNAGLFYKLLSAGIGGQFYNLITVKPARGNRLFVCAPLCNIVTQCWYFDRQFPPSKLQPAGASWNFQFEFCSSKLPSSSYQFAV